ncbi:MAG: hypothetical protein NXI24_06245 [bacterium]|nr:hypothetical protein [bacterium]
MIRSRFPRPRSSVHAPATVALRRLIAAPAFAANAIDRGEDVYADRARQKYRAIGSRTNALAILRLFH